MDAESRAGKQYDVKIEGPVSGQVAVGERIGQRQTVAPSSGVTEAELAELQAALGQLRAQVEATAPPDKKEAALERVDELADATTGGKPDLTTMEYVRNWFVKYVPQLAGVVTSVVVNPIVGKLVAAAGDTAAQEWRRRFGVQQ